MGVTSIASPAIASADDCYVDTGTLQGVVDGLDRSGRRRSPVTRANLIEGNTRHHSRAGSPTAS